MNINNLLEENPVIAAVKNEEQLKKSLNSNADIIFVLFGDLINIKEIGHAIYESGKVGILHIDLIEGLSNKEVVIKYLKAETEFNGIISTKSQMVKSAKANGLFAIQRVFVYDSISFENVKKHMSGESDAIEVLPGIMPKVIKNVSSFSTKPIIAGGLIDDKEEVILALNAGATCVSTSKEKIWDM